MPTLFQISAFVAFIINAALGLIIYWMNVHRRINQYFLIASMTLALWLGVLAYGSGILDVPILIFWIRFATIASCFMLPAFDLLRLAIMNQDNERGMPYGRMIPWVILIVPTLVALNMPAFIRSVDFGPGGFPRPAYGWPQMVYVIYFLGGLILLIGRFVRDFRQSTGIQRIELEFTVLAFAVAAIVGLSCGQIIPLLTGFDNATQLMPLSSVLLDVVVAYGIATQRIMNVGEVLRRSTAYVLLAVYMSILYMVVLSLTMVAFAELIADPSTFAHLLAALVVAFSMAPANGRLQRVAARLFINVEEMNVGRTVREAQEALSQIDTIDAMMERFCGVISAAAGTDRFLLMVSRDGAYEQVYPKTEQEDVPRIENDEDLIGLLWQSHGPLTTEALTRMRPTPQTLAAIRTLKWLNAHLAVGIHSKERLEGVMLLGARLSGRIYGPDEQDALQIICNQFAASFENSKLYTEVEDGKIYNDMLVDSLSSGVIAVTADGTISVFNREAQRITGMSAESALNQPIECIAEPLSSAFKGTLDTGLELIDKELAIVRGEDIVIPIRLSCSRFRGHQGNLLGTLGVFGDLTLMKKLEAQVRRSDRLSSIGTLAAGMAHEIKNPLVSISTFTQLLPERYQDEEFRDTFFNLIGKEVKRIDSIVARLLKFSRPVKPMLHKIHLHNVIEDSLKLISQQLRRDNVTLSCDFNAESDLINGDVDLLGQSLINFFLNAVESMNDGEDLKVSTMLIKSRWYAARYRDSEGRLQLSIEDTGCGIAPDEMPRVFDPFFSTKSSGTGLGLAVAHGILEDHSATVEVESVSGHGTVFHILFPLVRDDQETES